MPHSFGDDPFSQRVDDVVFVDKTQIRSRYADAEELRRMKGIVMWLRPERRCSIREMISDEKHNVYTVLIDRHDAELAHDIGESISSAFFQFYGGHGDINVYASPGTPPLYQIAAFVNEKRVAEIAEWKKRKQAERAS